jgi:hypothetical protein
MDWFSDVFPPKPQISRENPWFPVSIFPHKPTHGSMAHHCEPFAPSGVGRVRRTVLVRQQLHWMASNDSIAWSGLLEYYEMMI